MLQAELVVRCCDGLVAGCVDQGVRVFKGIPYAKPPVAELRWRPPQMVEPWKGVRPATSFGPRCVQFDRPKASISYFPAEPESEDCLYLNVWAPSDGDRPYPVMVWFHGGGYNVGSGSLPLFHGGSLARGGVILVTMNYRLGRLGFLAHPDLTAESEYGASGNYGLLDQLAALQWVHRNIAAFGGDPGCVTIFGQSAGAYSVSYFMTSPLAKGLFHRAIGQSGGGFGPVDFTSGTSDALQALPDAEVSGVRLASRIGVKSIAALRMRNSYEIQMSRIDDGFEAGQGYDRFKPPSGRGAFDNAYPIVDGYLIPDTVRSLFERGAQHDVPLMTGSNSHERGTTVQPPPTVQSYIDDARAQYGDLADRYLDVYPAHADADSREVGGYAIGDRIFTWQNWKWARAQASSGKSPVFYYRFTRVPPHPTGKIFVENPQNIPRAYHGAEIAYVFGSFDAWDWPWQPEDVVLSERMTRYWTNFAKTADPNGEGLPQWPSFNDTASVLFLDGDIKVGTVPNPERLDLWDEFYSRQPTTLAEHLTRRHDGAR